MRYRTLGSPHLLLNRSVSQVMQTVIIGLIPGACVLVWFFGVGVLVHCIIALSIALSTEAACLRLRKRPIAPTLSDGSAAVTAILLALALPPTSPWWMTAVGTAFAILFGKHLYGGLGFNPFNPAMLGYVLLLISFPKEMTAWLPAKEIAPVNLGHLETIQGIFTGHFAGGLDAITSATALDIYRTQIMLDRSEPLIFTDPAFGLFGGFGWQWVNIAFLLGGLWLLHKRIIGWQIPLSFIATLASCSVIANVLAPDYYLDPMFHLFSGATMLGAFFIATDPVSASTTPKGKVLFGVGVGLLVFVIRTWGGYPDAVAFAVLLMNMAAPTLDHYTQPKVFGTGGDTSA